MKPSQRLLNELETVEQQYFGQIDELYFNLQSNIAEKLQNIKKDIEEHIGFSH